MSDSFDRRKRPIEYIQNELFTNDLAATITLEKVNNKTTKTLKDYCSVEGGITGFQAQEFKKIIKESSENGIPLL